MVTPVPYRFARLLSIRRLVPVLAVALSGCAIQNRSTTPASLARIVDAHAPGTDDFLDTARSQDPDPSGEGDRVVHLGVGFTSSPGTALVAGQLDYFVTDDWAVGPALRLGLSSDDSIVAPSFNVKRVLGMQRFESTPWRPFVQAGVGMAFLHDDRRFGDRDDEGLLLNGGAGIEVFLDNGLKLTSTLTLNLMPGKVLGERTFFSWQILQMQFDF